MTGKDEVLERVRNLSDKQACHVVKMLTQDMFKQVPNAPSVEELGRHFDKLAADEGISLDLQSKEGWSKIELDTKTSGREARSILEVLVTQAGLEDIVNEAMNKYSDESLDLGLISIPIVLGLVYIAISSGFEIKLGKSKITKKALTGSQIKDIVIKTLPEVAKAMLSALPK
jgi:hypothetical protein